VADQEVRDGNAGAGVGGLTGDGVGNGCTGEGEDAVVIQQRLQAVLLKVKLRAGIEGVRAARGAEYITNAIEAIARQRSTDGVSQGEETRACSHYGKSVLMCVDGDHGSAV
jgi:hypothetical protein